MVSTEIALAGLGYAAPTAEAGILRLSDDALQPESVVVAEEVPIAIVYNGRPHVVVMGTPVDLEDLAVGFSVTESIVDDAGGIARTEVVRASHGIELQIELFAQAADRLEARARGLIARTGCGLCGVETIKDAMRMPDKLPHTLGISRESLWLAAKQLAERQTLNNRTSTIHAAAWANASGEIQLVREDVGRHNALDKVLGALLRAGTSPSGGFVVITSRASYEMVQKAAACGVELVAAISRPTALAIRFATESGVTLVGLLRGRTANVYTGSERIT